jgi:hypothetical protein
VKARENPERLDAAYKEGYIVHPPAPNPLYEGGDPSRGFSELGREKAACIFNLFDYKKDGGLSFVAFSDYLTCFKCQRPSFDMNALEMFYNIMGEIPPEGGKEDADLHKKRISLSQFTSHLEGMQEKFKIITDLHWVGMDDKKVLSDLAKKVACVVDIFVQEDKDGVDFHSLEEMTFLLSHLLPQSTIREGCKILDIKDMRMETLERFSWWVLNLQSNHAVPTDGEEEEGEEKENGVDILNEMLKFRFLLKHTIRKVSNFGGYVKKNLSQGKRE